MAVTCAPAGSRFASSNVKNTFASFDWPYANQFWYERVSQLGSSKLMSPNSCADDATLMMRLDL